jgi:hypothetical protein
MNNFVYQNPTKIIFGKETIGKIGEEIKNHNIKSVLILYGKGSIFKNGVYDKVVESLKANDIQYIEKGGVKPNPVLSFVRETVRLVKENNIEAILAVGGGSVIDSAKAIGAGAVYDGDIWDAFEGNVNLSNSLPIFSVLTLSATGSEMNGYAVITNETENKKWAFTAGLSSYPKVSVIDPTVQFTLPKEQTVYGAIDVLSHIFELYFDGTPETDLPDELAEGLVRTIIKSVKTLIDKPEDYNARANLAWSATLALNGIIGAGRNYGDWATHSIEHSISAFYDVAHGAGLAVIFPAWMSYNINLINDKLIRLGRNVFSQDINEGSQTIKQLVEFYKSIGAPVKLTDFGIQENDLDKLADNAALQAPLGALRKLERDDIYQIYSIAFKGEY